MRLDQREIIIAVGAFVGLGTRSPAQSAADTTPPVALPGRLVDVGGWRLHLNCTGRVTSSQPTVILEAGIGDFSVEWSVVQPEVAKFARVCSYDRAGDGWSDLGPHPRTMHQIAYELHELLHRASEQSPYVLVGHSYGGLLVRVYQTLYPTDVAAMVLVEAGGDDPLRVFSDGRVMHASDLATGKPVPAVNTSTPLRESAIPPEALGQMKAAAVSSGTQPNPGSRTKLPADAQHMRAWTLARWQHLAAAVNPFDNEELMALRAARMSREHQLDSLPLIVITGGISDERGADAAARQEEHKSEQIALTKLSSRGEQVIAARSGHHVQLDEPNLVAAAIQRVLAVLRK